MVFLKHHVWMEVGTLVSDLFLVSKKALYAVKVSGQHLNFNVFSNTSTWHALKANCRSSHPEVFLEKGVLKICSKFTGEHPCQSAISINIDIALRHGCSPVNLLHIFRTTFLKNTSGRLLLKLYKVLVCWFRD